MAAQASGEEFDLFPTWVNWTRLLDSALLGGPQSTFLAVAAIKDRVVGVCVGDSRLYYLPFGGEIKILTEESPQIPAWERKGRSLPDPPANQRRRHPSPDV